jgi:pimeloyl-ACP methyl ester carboxylesterase
MSARHHLLTAAIVPLAAAGLLLAGAPGALAQPGSSPTWRYCPDPDAYRLTDCADPPALPSSPAGAQLAWALRQLAGGAASLTEAEVATHYSPDYLTQVAPASAVVADFRRSLAELGTLTYQGMAFPPRTSQAVALAGTGTGERGSVGVSVDPEGRIESLMVQPAAPTIVPHGRYSGLFPVAGRQMFLRCTGTGSPTVVFELGLSTDWRIIQDALSSTTRVCSYDPPNANGPFSRSDPGPTPRTSADVVADLDALLRTAGVPGPYVLAGFSNGGVNSLLYASTHPDRVTGLALIDGVHPDYYARRFAALQPLLPPDVYAAFYASSLTLPPRLIDPEQFDIVTSQAQTRAALAAHPLRRFPLAVITHGVAAPPPPTYPDWPVAADEALWTTLQNELAALEPGSRHVLAADSDHDIPLNRPDLVISTVRDLVAQVRAAD